MRFLTALLSIACAGSLVSATALENGSADVATAANSILETRQSYSKCATPGYRRSNRPYFSRKSVTTSKACGERCWSEDKCKSYSFGQGTCSLFSVELSRNLLANNRSPIKFYEKSCAAPPPPTYGDSCRLTGYDDANANKKFFTKSSCNLASCSALCKSKSRCQSFKQGQNTCMLFTAPVASRSFKRDSKSAFTYYDKNCVVSSASTTALTSTTTKQAGSTTQSSASSSVSSASTSSSVSTSRSSSSVTSTTTSSSSSSSSSSTTTSSVTTTTSSSSGPQTTIENVRIAFKTTAKRKRQTDGSGSLSNGYISRDFKQTGERYYVSDSTNALLVKITVPQGGSVTQTRLNLIGENSATNQDLTALALVRNTAPGQANQLFLGAAFPGAPPADGTDNSLKRANTAGSYVAQSAIWTVNLQTFETSAQWINDDGSATPLTLLTDNGALFMTSDPSAFPNAQTLSAQASFPDPAAACATVTNYEYVNGQCVPKCQTGFSRIPGTTQCAVPLAPCPEGQRNAAGLCVCIDRTQQVFNGACVPLCNSSLNERRNATTGACGCRADMTRASNTDKCSCPNNLVDSGTSCGCADTAHVLDKYKMMCVCQDYTQIEINGICTARKPDQNFNRVRLSFNLRSAGPSKRQTSGSSVDLGYGYVSKDFRTTGERYLTNDATNALNVNFVVPDTGSSIAKQLSVSGAYPAPSSPYIVHLALIFDNSTLNTGIPFGSSGFNRLNLGAGGQTYAGQKPNTDDNNSMDPSRGTGNDGKEYVYETAVWTVDTSTGNLDAYWIDDTGASFHMIPVTNGDNLFFAGEGIYDQINATPLQLRAELPGTTAPSTTGGSADCRTGQSQCPACSDAINQCRAPDGSCVARDEVGACGYNCFPGNANAPASPDCWKCPPGYFGSSQSGCVASPCPDPSNQFRNRTGCFTIPTCVPPQVYVGNGQCAMQMSDGFSSVAKPRTSTSEPASSPTA
ncbi:putative PAN/Apple domain-containing protein [Septoria linicola]|nr:putative PAN/Apple domain-containing protein [Septoria linicola]